MRYLFFSLLMLIAALLLFAVAVMLAVSGWMMVVIGVFLLGALFLFKPLARWRVYLFHFVFYFIGLSVIYLVKKPTDQIVNQQWYITGGEKVQDSLLSYHYPSDTQRHEIITRQGDTTVNATYTYDRFGRRKMPERDSATKSVLFFGCSYTYGDGVKDDETLPYQFYLQDTTANVYNYAVDGWGPQQSMLLLQNRKLNEEITGDSVTGFFVFLDDHIRRAICSKKNFTWWTKDFPYFELEDDSLVYKGTFKKALPVKSFLFETIYKTKLFDFFDIPIHLSPHDYEVTAEIIRQSSLAFARQFPQGKFYVLLFPQSGKDMLPYLQKRNLQVIDCSGLFSLEEKFMIPDHGHPNAQAYTILAKQVFRQVDSLQSK